MGVYEMSTNSNSTSELRAKYVLDGIAVTDDCWMRRVGLQTTTTTTNKTWLPKIKSPTIWTYVAGDMSIGSVLTPKTIGTYLFLVSTDE